MTGLTPLTLAYCGAPPTQATLWARWNLDPLLIAALLLCLAACLVWDRARPDGSGRLAPWARGSFLAGWAIAAVALISPLCALSVSLFSARVGQHMVLTLIAAPLVALGLPRFRRSRAGRDAAAAAAFAVALWFWHAPGPYAATFVGAGVYWLMHLTTFGAALAFWMAIVSTPMASLGRAVALMLATSLQMAFLGAIIALAGRPLFAPHVLTTAAWGLTPLQDQQIGGALMWAPAGLILVVAILAPLALLLRPSDSRLGAPAR